MAVLTGSALLATVPIALAADASDLQSQTKLHADGRTLEARASAATLELYALETELRRTQADLDALAARRTEVARDRTVAQRQLEIAKQAVLVSESELALLVRALYEQPHHGDPLVVLLSAASLDEALAGLDSLSRAAGEHNRIIEQARATRTHLVALGAQLAAQEAELDGLSAVAEQRAADLDATAAARRTFVAGLRRRQGLDAARVAAIEARVRAAEEQTAAISSSTQPVASPVETAALTAAADAIATDGARTVTVTATGYSLRGRTATGMQTAPGVVAVDPSVIPLGTRLTIPGYGAGIAADTGGAVQGNVIDLWFPTTDQALAWGRRTVTITIR